MHCSRVLCFKIQKLHKAAKWLQFNWDFMNKIEVIVYCCILPTLAQLQSGAKLMKIKKDMASVYITQTYLQTEYKLD